jgi:hypothetical protein
VTVKGECSARCGGPRGKPRTSESDVVKVSGKLDRLHFPTDVELFHSLAEVSDGGMSDVISSEDVDRFFDPIKGINILNREDGQCLVVAGVEQSEPHAGPQLEIVDLLLGNVEGDGDGKQCTIRESQVLDHTTPMRQNQGSQSSGGANLS